MKENLYFVIVNGTASENPFPDMSSAVVHGMTFVRNGDKVLIEWHARDFNVPLDPTGSLEGTYSYDPDLEGQPDPWVLKKSR